jgi:succinoglycan biosynthesis protein ExoA
MKSSKPFISVLIPCRNEEASITSVLHAFAAQEYPVDRMEIILADGQSADKTRERITDFASAHLDISIRLLDNPGRTAPAGINAGLRVAKGEIILRMDAHSIPQFDYVRQCVDLLESTGCAGVGGAWDVVPSKNTFWARAIAVAGENPFATGGARYRVGGAAGEVETVPFGAYRRDLFERLGGFNEAVPVNEDYEWNYRVRKSGGKIYYSPAIRSTYFARSTLATLTRQYYAYGHQKAVMLSFHPESLRIRQLIPALFLPSLVAGLIGGLLWFPCWIVLLGELAAYGLAALGFASREAVRRRAWEYLFSLPLVFFLMHASWGFGFFVGITRIVFGQRRSKS